LPYVAPARLLTIYGASEAIRTEIYLGRTVHEFLRRLDVPITRGERGSLRVRQSTAAPHSLRDLN
jgi:hypothetical protein